jgi:uncharacterized protein YsxB (DUF464 family)
MTPQQQEVQKETEAITNEIQELHAKYMKVFGWDIPENNEHTAAQLILTVMQNALDQLREHYDPPQS